MRKAILDTSFIVTCARQKIDFIHELSMEGIRPLVPSGVIKEIEGLSKTKGATLAKAMLEKSMRKLEIIDINGKTVDSSIINYAHNHPNTMVATLDREIKSKVKNQKIVIRQKKKIEIV